MRDACAGSAQAFVTACRAIAALWAQAAPEHQEFVAGEVACILKVSPATGSARLGTALAVMAQPRLVAALEHGEMGVPHALTLLSEVEHLDPPTAARVLEAVLGDPDAPADRTPAELRSAAKSTALVTDPAQARERHQRAKEDRRCPWSAGAGRDGAAGRGLHRRADGDGRAGDPRAGRGRAPRSGAWSTCATSPAPFPAAPPPPGAPTATTDCPTPVGRTAEGNLQNAVRRWHRAKHAGWRTHLLPDGTVRWTSPTTGHSYDRSPKRTRPPKIPPGCSVPPIPEGPG